MGRSSSAVVLILFGLLCLAGCGDDDETTNPTGGTGASNGTGATAGAGAAAGSGGGGGAGGMSAPCDAPDELRDVVIEDQDFDDARWVQKVVPIPPLGADTTGTRAGQSSSGGADGPYRSMTHQIMNPDTTHLDCSVDDCSFTFEVLHQYKGEPYDPSNPEMGAIKHIDYSESHIIMEPEIVGAAVAWTFAVWQDDIRYSPPREAFTDLAWTTVYRCGLTADDFTPADPPLNLKNGGPITFGYVRANTNTQPGGTQTRLHGIDNFQVVIVKEE